MKSRAGFMFFILWFVLSSFLFSQNKEGTTVTVKKGQSIRDLAKEYLDDADLWGEILKLNNLKNITDVKPGMTLVIPSSAVASAGREIKNAQKKIQEATALGAKLFAPEIIAEAIKLMDDALAKKKRSDWNGAVQSALKSIEFSAKAIDESKKKNNVQTQAVLSQKMGNVQGRGNNDLIWIDTPIKSQLSEGQKVRTLSQSFAEISFKDASKLVMNANSQAIIQKMRKSVLENKQESKVSLVEGDIYALLSGNKKKKISVDINGVEAKINADRFWFNKTGNSLKVASYGGSIELYQNGKTIIIGENKGTIIGTNTTKSDDAELLPATSLKSPAQNTTVFKSDIKNEINFSWDAVPGAQRYWLEIANENSSFTDLIFSQDNIGINEFRIYDVKNDGVYYWRITPIDKDGFPGQRSIPRVFKVITDNSAPYLSVFSPLPGEILKTDKITISGETENFVELTINDEKTSVDSSGKFSKSFVLKPGPNNVVFSLKDLAANTDTVIRTFYYAPPKKPRLYLNNDISESDKSEFLTNLLEFPLSGRTDSLSQILVFDAEGNITCRTMSDSITGNFGVIVPLKPGNNTFTLLISTHLRDTLKYPFSVFSDIIPPVISYLDEIPSISLSEELSLNVKVDDAEVIYLNGSSRKISSRTFTEKITLANGYNYINLTAFDKAGNRSTLEKIVLFDNALPEKVTLNFLPQNAAPDLFFQVNVSVDRVSHETRRTALYEYAIGDRTYSGILRFSEVTKKFTDSFFIPYDYSGKIRITKITFQNSSGLTKDFTFN